MKNNSNNYGGMLLGVALGTIITFSADTIYKFATRYDKDGFDKNGYDRDGFDRTGFGRDGFNCKGVDKDGYDRNGFDCDGFGRDGFNRKGVDREGYNKKGFKDGYDRDGYDQYGYDREKFDRNGRDRRGYDRSGRNVEGYDRRGYDIDGYNKYGFAEDGFNKEGLDRDGYDRHGYNVAGIDREGCLKEFYEARFQQLRIYLDKAFSQLKDGEIAYALYEARRVLEETLEQYVKHYFGSAKLGKTPEENINICDKKQLLGQEIIKNLHYARKECNKDPHEIDARENLDYKTAWTVLLRVESFLEIAECDLVYG